LAISRVATASRQRTPPPLILKISREGTMFCPPPVLGHFFVPTTHCPVLFPLRQILRTTLPQCGLAPLAPKSNGNDNGHSSIKS
jgi:hypothetical protein